MEVYFMKSKFILSNRNLLNRSLFCEIDIYLIQSKFFYKIETYFIQSKIYLFNRNLFFSIEVYLIKSKFNLFNQS